jgi:hypothetical protein
MLIKYYFHKKTSIGIDNNRRKPVHKTTNIFKPITWLELNG